MNIPSIFNKITLLSLAFTLLGCNVQSFEKALAPDPKATKLDPGSFASPQATPSAIASNTSNSSNTQLDPVQNFADLDEAPDNLVSLIQDLAQLETLTPSSETADNAPLFQPNQVIDRATFARWLVNANNRLNRDRPARQIRLATVEASDPVFQDVPKTHPDFAYIQGLAEAGFIPSTLTGDATEKTFRPAAPLTRETLVAWKVPLDQQKILPTVTVAKVKAVWGFKDADKVSPQAASAMVADHANGDLSNIRRFAGSTLLFQPQKKVSRAEAAAALWFIGVEGNGFSAKDIIKADIQSTAAKPSPTAPPTNAPVNEPPVNEPTVSPSSSPTP